MKYQSLVEERLRHSDIISFLCEDLLGSVQNAQELAEQMQQANIQVQDKLVNKKYFQRIIALKCFLTIQFVLLVVLTVELL